MATTATPSFELPADHPGFSDPAYRERRAHIAAAGASYRPGDSIPDVHYTPEEDAVWATVSAELGEKHRRLAAQPIVEASARLGLPTDRVPQLREVDERLTELTGFHVRPVPGLVPTRGFYGALAERTFLATQYLRHHSVPYYTPEPDVLHEVVGHATMLADPVLADLYEVAGRASLRCRTDEELERFSKLFWFTVEFGVLWQGDELKAWGAGLLSSYAEIEVFRAADVLPWDVERMERTEYDITRYQPVLFAADSFDHAVEALTEHWS
jgi:phenylalanine-4-hydroxylase